jgi:hypothetical protein
MFDESNSTIIAAGEESENGKLISSHLINSYMNKSLSTVADFRLLRPATSLIEISEMQIIPK